MLNATSKKMPRLHVHDAALIPTGPNAGYFAKGLSSVIICANTFGQPAMTSPLYK
jgi:hypothetical protein